MTLEQELEAAYLELRKIFPGVRGIFDSEVWNRAFKGHHIWKVMSPGLESIYRCTKCNMQYVARIDDVAESYQIHNSECSK